MSVDHQVVKDVDIFCCREFLNFHAVKQSLINAISNSTAEGRCIVILLDFPDCDWIHDGRKGPVHPPCECPKGDPVAGDCCQSPRIIVTIFSLRYCFNQHIIMQVKYAGAFFSPLCLFSGRGHCGLSFFLSNSYSFFADFASIRLGSTCLRRISARYSKYSSGLSQIDTPLSNLRVRLPGEISIFSSRLSTFSRDGTRISPLPLSV